MMLEHPSPTLMYGPGLGVLLVQIIGHECIFGMKDKKQTTGGWSWNTATRSNRQNCICYYV